LTVRRSFQKKLGNGVLGRGSFVRVSNEDIKRSFTTMAFDKLIITVIA
jgi:hypothetical protein